MAIALVIMTLASCGGDTGTGPSLGTVPTGSSAAPTQRPSPLETPFPSTTPTQRPADVPSRVVVPALRIDLPVISGDVTLPGNPPDYPLCDVAHYLTTFPFPGRLGTTTWIYGHAREGMLLALLRASERDDGAELIGQMVDVYSTGNVRYRYVITSVLRHATDRSSAQGVPADEGRLVLQTSEGPTGTVPKLQVVAKLDEVGPATPADSQPVASPTECYLG